MLFEKIRKKFSKPLDKAKNREYNKYHKTQRRSRTWLSINHFITFILLRAARLLLDPRVKIDFRKQKIRTVRIRRALKGQIEMRTFNFLKKQNVKIIK